MQGPQILLTQQDAAASFDFTATFSQAAGSWDASAAETFASTATIVQAAAEWAAVASEAFAATGSFTQAAAAWDAIVGETFAATASFEQGAATWSADLQLPVASTSGRSRRRIRQGWLDLPQIAPRPASVEFQAHVSQAPAQFVAIVAVTDDDLVLLLAA